MRAAVRGSDALVSRLRTGHVSRHPVRVVSSRLFAIGAGAGVCTATVGAMRGRNGHESGNKKCVYTHAGQLDSGWARNDGRSW